jgi:CRP-like cAMP-binding protein
VAGQIPRSVCQPAIGTHTRTGIKRMISNTNTRNHLLSALPEEEFAEFGSSLTPVSLSHRQIIHERNTPIDHVYFIEQGITSVLTIMSNGAMSEVGMIGTEGVVGMSALLGAETSAQRIIVQVPGSALRMNAALCKASFDQRPAFHRIVLRFVDAFLGLSAQTAACNLLHSAEQRCARWLLMASARIRSDTMPMTHEFLSSMLGIRRTGITAIAGTLQRSGVIQYHRGRIRITDHDGLAAAACECYRLDRERIGRLP